MGVSDGLGGLLGGAQGAGGAATPPDPTKGPPPGLVITYQGKQCLSIFEFQRSVGLEPDYGFVCMHREEFENFVIRESVPGVDKPSDGSSATQEKPGPGARGFQSAGQLVFQEHIPSEPGSPFKVTWEQILVTERGVEVAFADDNDDNEVVHIPLTDIRYTWKNRGCVFGWCNVPKQGVPAGTSTDKSAGPAIVEGSLNDGAPWTVESVLVKRILPNLPFAPKLKFQEPKPAFFAKQISPKIWNGTLAKDAFAEVLDEFQLVVALNFDASVSIWEQGDGVGATAIMRTPDGGQFRVIPTSDPNTDFRVAAVRQLVTHKHIPAVAIVIGAPTIAAARMRLEACGEVGGDNGQVVPLPQALQAIGLDMARAAKFAILTHEERSAKLGVSEEGLKAFERWAFKWYRLPGGVEENADKLPILDGNAAVGATGEFLPLRVFSEGHTVVKVPYLDKRSTRAGWISRIAARREQLKEVEDQLAKPAGLSDAEKKALQDKRASLQAEIKRLDQLVLNESGATLGLFKTQEAEKAVSDAFALAAHRREAFEAAVRKFGATSSEAVVAQAAWARASQNANQAQADFTASQAQDTELFKATEAAQAKVDAAQKEYDKAQKEYEADKNGNPDLPLGKLEILVKAQEELQKAKIAEGSAASAPNGVGQPQFGGPAQQVIIPGKIGVNTAGGARARAIADKIAEDLSKVKVEHIRVMVPVGFGEQNSSGYETDRARGIIKFGAVQGRVVATDPDFAATLEDGFLSQFAAVELEFAFLRKPGPKDDIDITHCYFSVWARTDAKGADGKPVIEQRPKLPPGTAPLVIGPRADLQEFQARDGKTNKPYLDVLARRLAEQRLQVDQSKQGGIVEFCRPVAILNSGMVLTVTWSVGSDERPKVTAHVGTFARLAQGPEPFRTRAGGGLVAPWSVVSQAVYIPQSLAR